MTGGMAEPVPWAGANHAARAVGCSPMVPAWWDVFSECQLCRMPVWGGRGIGPKASRSDAPHLPSLPMRYYLTPAL